MVWDLAKSNMRQSIQLAKIERQQEAVKSRCRLASPKVKQIIKKNASIRAILLECTERFGRGSQSLPTFEVFFQCYVVSDFN